MTTPSVGAFARGMGIPVSMLRGRMRRWLERPPEEREALLAESRTRFVCEACQDGGLVWMRRDDPEFNPARVAGLNRSMGAVVKFADPAAVGVWCAECPPEVQRWRQLSGRIAPADVDECRFSTFDAYSPPLRNLHIVASRWATRSERRPFLLLVGSAGVGKSHIAKATALQMAEHGYSVHFTTAAALLEEIRASFDRDDATQSSEAEVVQQFGSAGVLVIDDLGAEYGTAWAATKLEGIIFHRYERRALTVITANKDLAELAEHQGDRHLRLFDRLGDVRRTVYVEVEGESWRVNGGRPRGLAVVR